MRFLSPFRPAPWKCLLAVILLFNVFGLYGCQPLPPGDPELTKNTRLELVDWHITGLMIINCPVAWFRVANYNSVPIKDVTLEYQTYDSEGRPLDKAVYTIEGSVPPGTVKNFIEQYLGLVNLHSERLSAKLLSVSAE